MTNVLVIAQHEHGKITVGTLSTITAALKISENCDVLLACDKDECSQTIAAIKSIKTVLVCENPLFLHPLAEDLSAVIQILAKDYTHIFSPATTFGKNVIPRAAAICDGVCLSDITAVISSDTFVRPIYAGNAFETVQVLDQCIFATIRPTAFEAVNIGRSEAVNIAAVESDNQKLLSKITKVSLSENNFHPFEKTQFVSAQTPVQSRPDLSAAKIVLSGGRAFKSVENFKMLEALADKLGAAVGATRAAVDAGFAPNDLQVGQTGKVVAPNLYMAFGISGAIQHVAGIKESKVIVAVNQDPEAPIFQIADYGLVGDIFKILPELLQKI